VTDVPDVPGDGDDTAVPEGMKISKSEYKRQLKLAKKAAEKAEKEALRSSSASVSVTATAKETLEITDPTQ
jgi:hypothetical protein